MLRKDYCTPATEIDTMVYERLIPLDHYLRRVKAVVDFTVFREELSDLYNSTLGAPAEDPKMMVQLEFLQFHYNLSDREVIAQSQVNVAFREFLDLSITSALPDPSTLCVFRRRLGSERHAALFHRVVEQAREKGLVKDRLRLKDATHVLANIAIPTTLSLVAQVRNRLLDALRPFDAERVEAEEWEAQRIRMSTQDLSDAERLLHRVEHLRRVLAYAQALLGTRGSGRQEGLEQAAATAHLEQAVAVAEKVLTDRDHPDQGDKLLSATDPDARRGFHGGYYDGYLLDVAMDADSEIITAVNALPANADEARDASALLDQEQTAHDNRVQGLSIDGIGYRGDLLREWTDPKGRNLSVFVPPPRPNADQTLEVYGPRDFIEDEAEGALTCPAGETTTRRFRTPRDTGWKYEFTLAQCRECPLQGQCLVKLPQKKGRSVVKNDYALEYERAIEVARTEVYAQVRKEHPKIERKLNDMVRHHQARRARYHGLDNVRLQVLMTALAVNIRRIVRMRFTAKALQLTAARYTSAVCAGLSHPSRTTIRLWGDTD